MRIPVAREGLYYGVIPFILGIFFLSAGYPAAGIGFILVSVFIISFFRYPDRANDDISNLVYAPVDGKIICIREEMEEIFFNDTVRRISVFMNIFNVHVNYAPINGVVEYIRYSRGGFNKADRIKPEETNENNFIGIVNDNIKIGVRQVAGWIARRIVCDCRVGDILSAGRRFGLIKFGSRVDVFLPKDYKICVKVGDKVCAGRTVLAQPLGY